MFHNDQKLESGDQTNGGQRISRLLNKDGVGSSANKYGCQIVFVSSVCQVLVGWTFVNMLCRSGCVKLGAPFFPEWDGFVNPHTYKELVVGRD